MFDGLPFRCSIGDEPLRLLAVSLGMRAGAVRRRQGFAGGEVEMSDGHLEIASIARLSKSTASFSLSLLQYFRNFLVIADTVKRLSTPPSSGKARSPMMTLIEGGADGLIVLIGNAAIFKPSPHEIAEIHGASNRLDLHPATDSVLRIPCSLSLATLV